MDAPEKNPVLEVVGLHKDFGKKTVLKGIDIQVYPGECLGVFGLRAAGKTTLLHLLAGLESFKTGTIKIMGSDIRKNNSCKAAIGLVTQDRSLFQDLTAGENLDFIAALKGAPSERIIPLTEQFALQECLRQAVNGLDAGVYQRLAMACALLNQPQLLILDEPIKDIDFYSRDLITRAVQDFVSRGGACIYGFNEIQLAEQMDKIGWLDKGEITIYDPHEALEVWDGMIKSYQNKNGASDE